MSTLSSQTATSGSSPVRIRPAAHSKLRQLAAKHRITVIDAVEIAIETFAGLDPEERRKLIDRENAPHRKRRSKS